MKYALLLPILFLIACSGNEFSGNAFALEFHPISSSHMDNQLADRMNAERMIIRFSYDSFSLTGESVNQSGSFEVFGDSIQWAERSKIARVNGKLFLSHDENTMIELVPISFE